MADNPQSDLLTTGEAASFLGVAESTLNKWRMAGNGPRYAKLGALVKYRVADLHAFVETRTRQSTATDGVPLVGTLTVR
jgi:predicted DNA-binding transcriptional regulator AlpA